MASPFTRSSRRSEGLTTRSGTRINIATKHSSGIHHTQQQQPNIGKKRPRDAADEEEHAISKKRAKIAIEIASRPLDLPKTKTRSVIIKAAADSVPPTQLRQASPPKPVVTAIATQTPSPPAKKPVNHHEKVVNGIKHELDRLQPNVNVAELKDEKRKLRSQEDQWFKSELSAYLPGYDSVIGNIPKEDHILELDTPIIVFDSAKLPAKQPPRKSNEVAHEYPLKEFPDSLFTNLHNAQRVDFSFMDRNYKEEGGEDPLSDEYFESIHGKPERLEKSIRNADKGRAQHEKDQVMRLLEGLQGHDWLKLMGVSGITESKKKEYEPARDHFIRGCISLIEKFRWWREEEKRRKLEKEAAMAEAEEEENEDEEEAEAEEDVEEAAEAEDDDDNISNGDPPDYSDIDASAARQLHEEAIARSAPFAKGSEKRPKVEAIPHELEKDFVSFFKKPHLREAALGKTRRSGRSAAAWGHQVPDVPETEFDLTALLDECNDPEYMKLHARRKRRDRRVSKV